MQYILSEIELQELQDKAMAYDSICKYIDGKNKGCEELSPFAVEILNDVEDLL
jgi:hypothetical protein